MISPRRYRVSAARLLFQQFIIYPDGNVPGRPMYRFQPPVIHAHMFPPVSVTIITVSLSDYIADTTLDFFRPEVTLFASVHFQIRVVVINSQVDNPCHVTVPVNPCVVLSLNTSLMSQSSTFTTCLSVQPFALKSFRSIP